MSRILRTLLLVSLVVVWCSATWAAATPKYRMFQGNIKVDSRDYISAPSTSRTFGYPMRVGATADPGKQVRQLARALFQQADQKGLGSADIDLQLVSVEAKQDIGSKGEQGIAAPRRKFDAIPMGPAPRGRGINDSPP